MTSIKALLLPLAVCVALLVPVYELWSLDKGWRGAPDHALAAFANSSSSGESEAVLGECTYLLCPLVAPDDDDDDDEDN